MTGFVMHGSPAGYGYAQAFSPQGYLPTPQLSVAQPGGYALREGVRGNGFCGTCCSHPCACCTHTPPTRRMKYYVQPDGSYSQSRPPSFAQPHLQFTPAQVATPATLPIQFAATPSITPVMTPVAQPVQIPMPIPVPVPVPVPTWTPVVAPSAPPPPAWTPPVAYVASQQQAAAPPPPPEPIWQTSPILPDTPPDYDDYSDDNTSTSDDDSDDEDRKRRHHRRGRHARRHSRARNHRTPSPHRSPPPARYDASRDRSPAAPRGALNPILGWNSAQEPNIEWDVAALPQTAVLVRIERGQRRTMAPDPVLFMEDALRPSGSAMQIGLAHPRWSLLERRWGPIEATGGQRGYVTVLDVLAFVYHYLAEPLTEDDWAYLLPEVESAPLLEELSHAGEDGERVLRRRIDLLGSERMWNGLILGELHDGAATCLLSLRNTPQVPKMPRIPNPPLLPVQPVPPVLPVPPPPPAAPPACVLAPCRPAPALQINPLLLAAPPPRAPRLLWDVRFLPTTAEVEEVHADGRAVRDITKDDRSERAVLPRSAPLHIHIAPAAQRWGAVVVRPGIDGRVRVGDVLRKVHRWLRKEVREKDLVALAQMGVEVWSTEGKVRRADVLGTRTMWGGLHPIAGPDGQTQWWLRLEQ